MGWQFSLTIITSNSNILDTDDFMNVNRWRQNTILGGIIMRRNSKVLSILLCLCLLAGTPMPGVLAQMPGEGIKTEYFDGCDDFSGVDKVRYCSIING